MNLFDVRIFALVLRTSPTPGDDGVASRWRIGYFRIDGSTVGGGIRVVVVVVRGCHHSLSLCRGFWADDRAGVVMFLITSCVEACEVMGM